MAHDVFISHSSHDRAAAEAALAALERAGHSCWIAPRDIVPGAGIWRGDRRRHPRQPDLPADPLGEQRRFPAGAARDRAGGECRPADHPVPHRRRAAVSIARIFHQLGALARRLQAAARPASRLSRRRRRPAARRTAGEPAGRGCAPATPAAAAPTHRRGLRTAAIAAASLAVALAAALYLLAAGAGPRLHRGAGHRPDRLRAARDGEPRRQAALASRRSLAARAPDRPDRPGRDFPGASRRRVRPGGRRGCATAPAASSAPALRHAW